VNVADRRTGDCAFTAASGLGNLAVRRPFIVLPGGRGGFGDATPLWVSGGEKEEDDENPVPEPVQR
jgi:hypothetical protein